MASELELQQAADCVRNGGVIAYPTEGVWGLGSLPEDEVAVMKILALKQRSWKQGLLLVAARVDQFNRYLTTVTDAQMEQLNRDWPGPVTYLVPHSGEAPDWIVGTHETIGLRVSAHPLVSALCEELGPIVSTSANLSGQPSALTAEEVKQFFGDSVDMIVPGELGGQSGPSQIKVLETGEIIR